MEFQIKGLVVGRGPVETITTKKGQTFNKQLVFIKEIEGDYPQEYGIEFFGEKQQLAAQAIKDTVAVFHINLKGYCGRNKQTNKPFAITTLQCWKVEPAGTQQAAPQQQYQQPPPQQQPEDDLPF